MKINAQGFLCFNYLVYLNVNEMLKQAAFSQFFLFISAPVQCHRTFIFHFCSETDPVPCHRTFIFHFCSVSDPVQCHRTFIFHFCSVSDPVQCHRTFIFHFCSVSDPVQCHRTFIFHLVLSCSKRAAHASLSTQNLQPVFIWRTVQLRSNPSRLLS